VKAILVVAALEKGQGGGHFVRSSALVEELRALGREAYLYLPPESSVSFAYRINEEDLRRRSFDFVVLDCFQTPPDEYAFWRGFAPLIGIDEGGPCRPCFDFLIDELPALRPASAPNIFCPGFLPLPENRRTAFFKHNQESPLEILVSFGAEDPAGLTVAVAESLVSPAAVQRNVSALFGMFNQHRDALQGVRVLDALPRLSERLAAYDLVITHFGLTAFESIAAGVPVLLVAASPYHERLAKSAGFPSVRLKDFNKIRIDEAWLCEVGKKCEAIALAYKLDRRESLARVLATARPLGAQCPVCAAVGKPLSRLSDRTYRRCRSCGSIFMSRYTPPPIEYDKDYFFASYQKQYGKTYLDDFPQLVATGRKRLAHISALMQRSGGELMDIGCAYGPFLAAARDAGFSPLGLEIAADAVDYVQKTLGIPCFQLPFPALDRSLFPDGRFDVVSLWFVIEHFESLSGAGGVLAEIHRLLAPGGVLAFSTPSGSGISARKSLRAFLEHSPPDHFSIWEPCRTRKILRRAGFTLKKTVITGHHPERFPFIGAFLAKKRGVVRDAIYRILLLISRLFRLGDTFEVYAVKEGQPATGGSGRPWPPSGGGGGGAPAQNWVRGAEAP
jgi:SAM-dependent methyltransferase